MSDPFAPRPTDKPQLTREDLKTMHHLDIAEAMREGRCADMLTTPNPDAGNGYRQTSPKSEGVQGKDFESIVAAGKSGGR